MAIKCTWKHTAITVLKILHYNYAIFTKLICFTSRQIWKSCFQPQQMLLLMMLHTYSFTMYYNIRMAKLLARVAYKAKLVVFVLSTSVQL